MQPFVELKFVISGVQLRFEEIFTEVENCGGEEKKGLIEFLNSMEIAREDRSADRPVDRHSQKTGNNIGRSITR